MADCQGHHKIQSSLGRRMIHSRYYHVHLLHTHHLQFAVLMVTSFQKLDKILARFPPLTMPSLLSSEMPVCCIPSSWLKLPGRQMGGTAVEPYHRTVDQAGDPALDRYRSLHCHCPAISSIVSVSTILLAGAKGNQSGPGPQDRPERHREAWALYSN